MSPRRSHQGTRSQRSTLSLQKTEIVINVYDLLPPGRLASTLWFFGTSLLHSAVVINGCEYAFGGHDRPGITGVFFTKPRTEPPGGTFKCEILHGFTLATQAEIDAIVREASDEFQGAAYNLLTKNCNHFTSYLCAKLTGRPGPGWLNRAASIGVALPCVVPRDWIEPPDYGTADGELLDEDDDHGAVIDERSRMLRSADEQPHLLVTEEQLRLQLEKEARPSQKKKKKKKKQQQQQQQQRQSHTGEGFGEERGHEQDVQWDSEEERRKGGSGKGKLPETMRDSVGRALPPSEQVHVPDLA